MPRWTDVALFLVMASSWAINYPLVKIALQYEPPLVLLFFRVAFASVISVIIFRRSIKIPRDLASMGRIVIFALLNIVIFMGLWFIGEETETAAISSIIIYTYPILSILLSAMFLNDKLNRYAVAGTVFGFLGLVTIFADQLVIRPNIGLALLFGGALSWAIGTVYFKKFLSTIGNATVNSLQFFIALPITAAIAFPAGQFSVSGLTIEFLIISFIIGSIGTGVAYYIFLDLVSKYNISEISAYFFAVPALSLLFSFALIHEEESYFTILGFILVSVGIYLVSLRPGVQKVAGSVYNNSK
ncbi:MAG: DMT family transporter [Thermoplasmataceae archaeon]